MSELRSKCHGAEVDLDEEDFCGDGWINIKIPYYECSKCGKPTEVEEKKEEGK